MKHFLRKHTRKFSLGMMVVGVVIFSLALSPFTARAQSPLHPTFAFLDQKGDNVLETGNPVSTIQTCGQCHDTAFIAAHSYHADAGLSSAADPGEADSSRPWDTSNGLYGKWNPLTYRYLSPTEDEIIDLTSFEWIQTIGLRHVGGGPAEEQGIEMNCFLCHFPAPNNQARIEVLENGEFEWANTATLTGSELVSLEDGVYQWNQEAFDEEGYLLPAFISIQDPDNENCGQCHGTVHTQPTPLVLTGCEDTGWETATTGMVFSPERISESGMNIAGKAEITRSWDIHTERLVECTDCHFSLNNPVFFQGSGADSLAHLEFDPRRLDLGEYLYQPDHNFARGQSAQVSIAPELKDTMRRCESCHNPESAHGWLPYADKHMEAIFCETCHIPQIYSPAVQQVDWTVIETDSTSRTTCRGAEGDSGTINDLVTGYSPTLLQRKDEDGTTKLAPYNLVSAWFWVYGDPERPVPLELLQEAFLEEREYHPEVIQALDEDGSGSLQKSELVLDTEEKVSKIAARIESLGLENPRISAEIQPYSINHNVAGSEWALQDCETCHTEESRISEPIQLAGYVPGGTIPEFIQGDNTITNGELYVGDDGALYYQPVPAEQGLYIFGHNKVSWIDWFGVIMFLGVLGGITTHGGMRAWAARKRSKHQAEIKKIYMYTFYERLWHWLQTLTILILAFTGLVIHKPEMFGAFSFKGVVLVHNIMAGLLVANAVLALFYNLVSGDIKRFIPEPHGFFNQAVVQAKYYLNGIFHGDEHPFEKTREKRLNPLQKITYFGILNVLLPAQIITGILMWGVQHWPEVALKLGGLPLLAPIHTLVAWSFISFIVTHVYLTTTGHTPMAGIKSMVVGWDEVEVHSPENDLSEE